MKFQNSLDDQRLLLLISVKNLKNKNCKKFVEARKTENSRDTKDRVFRNNRVAPVNIS